MPFVSCTLVVMNNQSSRPSDPTTEMHSHWLNHEHAPFGVHLMVGLFITVVGIVAAAGNILVVLTCVRYKELRTRSNILIINLAVGDLLMCTIDFPLLAIASFRQGWPFGWIVCRFYAFLTAVAGLVTINTLGCISADRYWAVVWRTNPKQQPPRYVTALVVTGVWIYAVGWAICPILGWGDYVLDGIRTTCTFDYLSRSWSNRGFVLAMVGGNFILPMSVMLFSYTRIWMTVCDVKRSLSQHPGRVVVGMQKYPKTCLDHRQSMTLVDREKYYSLPMDNDSEDTASKLVVNSDNSDCWSKSKSMYHDLVHEDRHVADNKQDEVRTEKDNINSTVRLFKRYTSSRSGLVICQVESDISNHNEISRHPLRYFRAPRNNNSHINQKHCQDCCFVEDDNATSESHHSKEQSKKKKCIIRSQRPLSRKEFNVNINSPIENDSIGSIRRKFRFESTRNKLYLKQHRYRLHCEYKTIKIIMYLLTAFIISWFPYVVVSMIGLFGDANRITYLTSVFPSLVAKSSIVFNPILYSISHPKVRKRIFSLLFKKCHFINASGQLNPNTRFSSSFSYNSR